jgi:hypothetical protein
MRWLGRLFLALTLLQLVPIWSVRYLPTSDGATHLYNAWVMREILTARAEEPIKQYYQINWQPNPNWFGHAFMAAAMGVVPPTIAEKLLVSATILIFFAGLWFFTGANDERSRAYAFLGFPFAYNALLQMGFYNFAFSVGLYLLIVGVWWSQRDGPDASTVGTIGSLLFVCYFVHPMSTLMAMGSTGLMWLATLHGRILRRHAIHLIAFLPVLPLLYWFAKHSDTHVIANPRSWKWHWEFLADTRILMTFSDRQLALGRALFVVMMILFIVTLLRENVVRSDSGYLWRFRPADAFLLILFACIALYVLAPTEAAGGSAVTERLALLIPLIPLAWFSGRLPLPTRTAVIVLMSVVAVVNAFFLTTRFRHYDRVIRGFLQTVDPIQSNSTVLPIMFERTAPGTWMGFLSHAIAYKAIEKKLVDLGNYEPGTWMFPLVFKPEITPPDVLAIEGAPGDVRISMYAPVARYIHTWAMPDEAPIVSRILAHYRLVSASGPAKLYRRIRDVPALGESEMILLPIAGTRGMLGAPGGVRWQVDQQMTNGGTTPVRASISSCAPDTPCSAELRPAETVSLSAANESVRFLTVRVPKGSAGQLRFRTVAHRVDPFRPDIHVEMPAVHESAFRKGRIEIRDVPFSSVSRVSLRVWITGPTRAREFKLRLVPAGGRRTLAEKTFAIGPDGYWAAGDVMPQFPELTGEFRAKIVIEPESGVHHAQVWALVTLIDKRTEEHRNILPASGTGF